MSYQSLTNSLYNPSATVGTSGTLLSLSDTTQSSGTDSGALIVAGGTGIAKNLFVGGTVNSTGILNVNDTTQSTTTANGSLVVDGGVGIAKNLNVGGTLSVGGTEVSTVTEGSIGWATYLVNNSGGSIANGATTTGDNLLYFILDTGGNVSNGGAVGTSGETWQNITGASVTGTYVGYFKRTA